MIDIRVDARAPSLYDVWLMPCCITPALDVNGACYQRIFRIIIRCAITLTNGRGMERGNGSIRCCGNTCAKRRGVSQRRVLAVWIVRASQRRKPVANVGLTGEKNIRGRKRHVLVDTEGNLLMVVVHRANLPDRDGATFVLEDADTALPRLEKRWVDQAYNGDLANDMYEKYNIILEIVAKPSEQQGFVVV